MRTEIVGDAGKVLRQIVRYARRSKDEFRVEPWTAPGPLVVTGDTEGLAAFLRQFDGIEVFVEQEGRL